MLFLALEKWQKTRRNASRNAFRSLFPSLLLRPVIVALVWVVFDFIKVNLVVVIAFCESKLLTNQKATCLGFPVTSTLFWSNPGIQDPAVSDQNGCFEGFKRLGRRALCRLTKFRVKVKNWSSVVCVVFPKEITPVFLQSVIGRNPSAHYLLRFVSRSLQLSLFLVDLHFKNSSQYLSWLSHMVYQLAKNMDYSQIILLRGVRK